MHGPEFSLFSKLVLIPKQAGMTCLKKYNHPRGSFAERFFYTKAEQRRPKENRKVGGANTSRNSSFYIKIISGHATRERKSYHVRYI